MRKYPLLPAVLAAICTIGVMLLLVFLRPFVAVIHVPLSILSTLGCILAIPAAVYHRYSLGGLNDGSCDRAAFIMVVVWLGTFMTQPSYENIEKWTVQGHVGMPAWAHEITPSRCFRSRLDALDDARSKLSESPRWHQEIRRQYDLADEPLVADVLIVYDSSVPRFEFFNSMLGTRWGRRRILTTILFEDERRDPLNLIDMPSI